MNIHFMGPCPKVTHHSFYRRVQSAYSRISQSLFDQSSQIAQVVEEFRRATAEMGANLSDLSEARTLLKGLENLANMAVVKKASAKVSLSDSQIALVNHYFKRHQIFIPDISEPPNYQISADKKNFTLIEAVAMSGALEMIWNDYEMDNNIFQAESNQMMQNFRRALSYVNGFEKKATELKNSFSMAFRAIA